MKRKENKLSEKEIAKIERILTRRILADLEIWIEDVVERNRKEWESVEDLKKMIMETKVETSLEGRNVMERIARKYNIEINVETENPKFLFSNDSDLDKCLIVVKGEKEEIDRYLQEVLRIRTDKMQKIKFDIREHEKYTILNIRCGNIAPEDLEHLDLPPIERKAGLVISGCLPMWFFAVVFLYYEKYFSRWYKWIAAHPTTLDHAIVLESHDPDTKVGDVIKIEPEG